MSRALAHIGSPPDDSPVKHRRLAGVLGGGLGMVLVSAFILQSETVARVCVYAAGAVITGIFVSFDPHAAIAMNVPVSRCAGAGGADDFFLHLLPADVHFAESVRAEERGPQFQPVRLAPVYVDSRAIPEP